MPRRHFLAYAGLLFTFASFASEPATRPATSAAHDPRLAARLDPILHTLDSNGAVFAARVIDLSTGRELYAHDIDRSMMPASNGKLANTASALEHFGPTHTFPTYLAIDGDDLWLIGTGDPGCGDENIATKHHSKTTAMLDEWADALRARGITRVKGKLYFADGIFDDQWISPTWSRGYLTDWYAAPVTGLTFNDNCIDTTLYPTDAGEPARYEVVPPTAGVKIVNQTRTGSESDAASPEIERAANADVFTLKGVVAKKGRVESKPITDPGAFFADALRTNLLAHGIAIEGASVRADRAAARTKWPKLLGGPLNATTRPADDRVVAAHETSMADVLARIDKNSQNLFAEALCKMQGRDWNLAHGRDEPGSWRAGGEAIHDFLRRHGIDDSRYVLIDGSGLSRDNRVTTRMITDLFVVMTKHPYAEQYRASLTICGQDGTLRKRMSDITGLVRGKTGSIGGVRSLSGYATTRSGQTLVFSFMFNDAVRHEKQCEGLADNACRVLVEWPEVERAKLVPVTQPTTKEGE
jgi:D-alanyl-D-alanine carboxypeptidase/D-alanyl-D-alanine-endopeptidase (penicillin-binding protein 4)